MSISTPEKDFKPGIINILNCKCPRCRRGDMYVHGVSYNLKKFMKMNETCPVCGQVFDIEVGFYYGTGYVSYGLYFVFSVITFLLWWLIIGVSVDDNRVIYWLIINAILILAFNHFLCVWQERSGFLFLYPMIVIGERGLLKLLKE